MGYETTKLIIDIIFGASAFGIGLYYLMTPFEKLREKSPKLRSEKTVKVCGVLLVIFGALILVMGVVSLI